MALCQLLQSTIYGASTDAVGGLVVTASHNPIEWNGFKFIREDSTFFHPEDCMKLFDIVDKDPHDKYFPKFRDGMARKERNTKNT